MKAKFENLAKSSDEEDRKRADEERARRQAIEKKEKEAARKREEVCYLFKFFKNIKIYYFENP